MTHRNTTLRFLVQVAADKTRPLRERQQAYNTLVTRFQDMAFGCAYALLADAVSAEDAVQEAFLSAWHHLPQLRDPDAFPGWFKRIVVRCCHRQREQRAHEGTTVVLASRPEIAHDSPAKQVLEREQRAQLRAMVAALPETERLVVTLFYIGSYSRAEVATF